ncbi:MAG TPA: serine/threonine-protein kinase [Polyangiaceae bacterium]
MSTPSTHQCLTDAEVRAYTEGPLAAALRGALEARVGDCKACRNAVQAHAPTLDASLDTLRAAGTAGPADRLERGAALGRYVVLETLGEGGMGIVYAAYDPELDRKVALKLLRGERLGVSAEARARMVREGQAMARLSHPNVLPVHDVGTYEGRIFVAMEWVDGETLRAWVEPGRRWREIVAMYVQAGRGLAAAHDAGLVHRDFKPDNVLVGKDGRARVLDFGLARAREGAASASVPERGVRPQGSAFDTPLTRAGTVVGTPRYMAPEQLAGELTDAASDQFGFCASLYEALYGEPPFEGETLSNLFDSVESGRIRAAPAGRDVPSWLRAVVKRGLSAESRDRHPSMHALIAALEHDPDRARRRTLLGVAAAAGAAVVTTGIVLGLTHRPPLCPSAEPELAGVWGDAERDAVATAFHATKAPYAADALWGTTSALDAYAAGWVAMRGEACAATRVRGTQSDELFDLRVQCLRQESSEMAALVKQLAVADAKTVEGALRAVDALPPLSRCADESALRAPVHAPTDPSARARILEARRQVAEARALHAAGRATAAMGAAEVAVHTAKALAFPPALAEALEAEGAILSDASKLREAAAALDEATVTAMAGRAEATEAQAWIDLVMVADRDTRYADGDILARRAHAALERSPDDIRLAELLTAEGSIAEGEERLDVSEQKLRAALAIEEKVLTPEHPETATTLLRLAQTLMRAARYDESIALERRVLAIREKVFGLSHPAVAGVYNDLANSLVGKGEYTEAIAAYRHSLELNTAAYGALNKSVADNLQNLGSALAYAGQFDEGFATLERAIAVSEQIYPAGHDEIASVLVNAASAYGSAHRPVLEVDAARRAIAIIEARHGPSYPTLAPALSSLADGLFGQRQYAEAEQTAQRAIAIEESSASEPMILAASRLTLAQVLKGEGRDLERARRLAEEARATLAQEPVGNAEELALIAKEFPADGGVASP